MKNLVKHFFNLICIIIVLPSFMIYKIFCIFLDSEQTFQGMSQFYSLFPGLIGNYLRKSFYFFALKKCSLDCCISFGTVFSSPLSEIGKDVYIGTKCTLGDVKLDDYVLLGSNVDIINGAKQHYIDNLDIPIKDQGGEFPKVYIGEDTWIGNGALVMCNIGKKCVIGAHAVVNKEIPEYSIAVGNPARIVKKRI